LLVHGDLSIGESWVMLDYLAETYAFEGAYPASMTERTLQREAMAIVDGQIAKGLMGDSGLAPPRLTECVDRLEAITRLSAPVPSVMAFHVAPIWLRLQWWQPEGDVTRLIRRRPQLAEWLDATTRLSAVARTSPTRAENVRDFEAACALKLPEASP
jgi:glutathione S-transferase